MSAKEKLIRDYKLLLEKCKKENIHPGIAIENLFSKYIISRHYTEVFELLGYLLFSTDSKDSKQYISENNMYLYIMLEIYFLEKGNPTVESHIFERYQTLEQFRNICVELRLYIRRIWFQYPDGNWKQSFATFLSEQRITAEHLAVISKYTVPQNMLLFTMEQLSHYLPEHLSIFLDCYRKGMEGTEYTYNLPDDFLLETTPSPIEERELDASIPLTCSKSNYDEKKIAIILCKNNNRYASEVKDYISCMNVPSGFSLEFITVKNANSMASGYNYAMNSSNAKYKFYIHQDTFFICPSIFQQFLQAFEQNSSLGLLGIVGCTELPPHGKWWDSDYSVKRMLVYQDGVLIMLHSKSIVKNGLWEPADALDGILLATAYDIPWRDDLFDGWHFYDISQCFEFRNAGYITGALNSAQMMVLHETTTKIDPQNLYELYRQKFVDTYLSK